VNDSGDGHAIPGSKKRSESIPRVYHAALLVRRAVRAGCREVVSGNDRKSGLRAHLNDIKHLRGNMGCRVLYFLIKAAAWQLAKVSREMVKPSFRILVKSWWSREF
jgi:hypothetical protein